HTQCRDDRHVGRAEVRRAHDLIFGCRPLTLVDRWIADDLERETSSVEEIERQLLGPANTRDAGNGCNLRLDLIEELLQRLGCWILRSERIDQHRQDTFGAIAAIER